MIDRMAKIAAAAHRVLSTVFPFYHSERGLHAETVIGAVAALTGHYALAATTTVVPGMPQWIVSADTADLLVTGSKTGGIAIGPLIAEAARRAGVATPPRPEEVLGRIAGALGGTPFPPLSIPQQHFPTEWSPNAVVRLRPVIDPVLEGEGLNPTEKALTLAVATGLLIGQTAAILPPDVACILALEISFGVAHMRPLDQEIR